MVRYQYQLLCLLAIIFYASDPIIAKLGLKELPLFWFLGLSQMVAAVSICLVYGLRTELKLFLNSSWKTKFFLIVISITNSIIGPLLFLTGVQATSGINATLIGRTEGIITGILGIRLLGERKLYRKCMGMGIALIGIIIISSAGQGITNLYRGDLLIIAATGVWALGSMLYKKYLSTMKVEIFVFLRNLLAGLFFLSIAAITNQQNALPSIGLEQISYIVLYALLAITIPQFIYFNIIGRVTPMTIGLIMSTTPLRGISMAMIILGESISGPQILGGLLILAGALWGTLPHRKAAIK